jgi:hypothetical protein
VPLDSGSEAAVNASPSQTRQKHVLNVLGAVNLVAELALVAIEGVKRRY